MERKTINITNGMGSRRRRPVIIPGEGQFRIRKSADATDMHSNSPPDPNCVEKDSGDMLEDILCGYRVETNGHVSPIQMLFRSRILVSHGPAT